MLITAQNVHLQNMSQIRFQKTPNSEPVSEQECWCCASLDCCCPAPPRGRGTPAARVGGVLPFSLGETPTRFRYFYYQSVLVGIVQQTCKVLNIEYGPQDLKDVYGINTKSGGTTIVAEFTQALKNQEVLKTAKAFNKENRNNRLNSTHIGLPGKTVPIYISESLTSKARRLFYLARDLAKSTDYKYCWTSNGKVFIRKNDDSPHIEIKSENDVLNQKSLK
ncbi:hypothetical protein ACJJTC_004900 [Scirpophaga incertulas]